MRYTLEKPVKNNNYWLIDLESDKYKIAEFSELETAETVMELLNIKEKTIQSLKRKLARHHE